MDVKTFFVNFKPTDISVDPLPLKVINHSIESWEVNGQAIYWAFQYLYQKNCPSDLLTPLFHHFLQALASKDIETCAVQELKEKYEEGEDVNGEEIFSRVSYQPLKLMQTVTGIIDAVCMEFKALYEDSQDVLDAPAEKPNVYEISFCTMKNTRRSLEDRMIILPNLDKIYNSKLKASYFAVFDGHNGVEAAAYAAAQLHQNLISNEEYPVNIPLAINKAFESTDAHFLKKCIKENIRSGATAVLALVDEKQIHVAWAGDSQAVLVKSSEIISLVSPHKPEREDEMQRIRDVGGDVLLLSGTWRVNGNLAVSRAIGDYDYKTYIISTPEVRIVERDEEDEFLILACDGLWDDISPQRSAQLVRKFLVENGRDLDGLSQTLASEAKKEGCGDNITIIVVFLQPIDVLINRYRSQDNTVGFEVKISNAPNADWKFQTVYPEVTPISLLDNDTLEIEKMDISSNNLEDYLTENKEADLVDAALEMNAEFKAESGEQDVDKLLDLEVLSQPDDDWKFQPSYPNDVSSSVQFTNELEYDKNHTNPFLQSDLSEDINAVVCSEAMPTDDGEQLLILEPEEDKLNEVLSQTDNEWTFQTQYCAEGNHPESLSTNGMSELPASNTFQPAPINVNPVECPSPLEDAHTITPSHDIAPVEETTESSVVESLLDIKIEKSDSLNNAKEVEYGSLNESDENDVKRENSNEANNYFDNSNNDTVIPRVSNVSSYKLFEDTPPKEEKIVEKDSSLESTENNTHVEILGEECNNEGEIMATEMKLNAEVLTVEDKCNVEILDSENKIDVDCLGSENKIDVDCLGSENKIDVDCLGSENKIDVNYLGCENKIDVDCLGNENKIDADCLGSEYKIDADILGVENKLDNELQVSEHENNAPDLSIPNSSLSPDILMDHNNAKEAIFELEKISSENLDIKDLDKKMHAEDTEGAEKEILASLNEGDLKLTSIETTIESMNKVSLESDNSNVLASTVNGDVNGESKVVIEPAVVKSMEEDILQSKETKVVGNEVKTSKAVTNEKIKQGVKTQDVKKIAAVTGVKSGSVSSATASTNKRPLKTSPIAKNVGSSPTATTSTKTNSSPSSSARTTSAKPTAVSKPAMTSPRVSAKTLTTNQKPTAPAVPKSAVSSTTTVAKARLVEKKPPSTPATKSSDAVPKLRTAVSAPTARPPRPAMKTDGGAEIAKKESKPLKPSSSIATKTVTQAKPAAQPSTSRPKPTVSSNAVPKQKPSVAPTGTASVPSRMAPSTSVSKVSVRKEGVAKPSSSLADKKPAKVDAVKTVPPIKKTVTKSITETKKVAVGNSTNKVPVTRPTVPKPAKDPKLPAKVSPSTTKKVEVTTGGEGSNEQSDRNTHEVSNDANSPKGGLSGPEAMTHYQNVSNHDVLPNGDGCAKEELTNGEAEKLIDFAASAPEGNSVVVTNGNGGLEDGILLGSKETPNLLQF